MYAMDRQWCDRKRHLENTPWGFPSSVGEFHLERPLKICKLKLEGSFQAKCPHRSWKDPGVFSRPLRGISLLHHWRSIVYMFIFFIFSFRQVISMHVPDPTNNLEATNPEFPRIFYAIKSFLVKKTTVPNHQTRHEVRLLSKKSWKFWFVVLELVIGYGEQDKSLKVKVKISWCLLFFQWIFGIGIFITKIYEKWIPTTSIIVNWWLYDHLDHWKLQANLRKKKMNMTKRNKALKIYTSKWNPLCIGQVVSLIHCGDESSQIC